MRSTAAIAAATVGSEQTTVRYISGKGVNFKLISPSTTSVPSDPT